jgi:uncharacterized repeat protein (TIGR03803 family)
MRLYRHPTDQLMKREEVQMISNRILNATGALAAGVILSCVFNFAVATPAAAQSTPTVAYSFKALSDGGIPTTGLTQEANGDFVIGTEYYGANGAGTIDQLSPVFKSHALLALSSSDGNGVSPNALIKGPDGYYYGTTFAGADPGILFKISSNGKTFKILHTFDGGVDGEYPDGSVTFVGLNAYGVAAAGGTHNNGIIYKIEDNGLNFKILHNFKASRGDGESPYDAPILDQNGLLYGVAFGDSASTPVVHGTIYSIDTKGVTFTAVYTFTGGADGDFPAAGRLIQDASGNIYGTSYGSNGTTDDGALWEFTPGAGLTVLHTFAGTDGQQPYNDLLLDNGTLYGACELGGANGIGSLYTIGTTGSGFNPFFSFDSTAGGPAVPNAGNLILGIDGSIYGATFDGGANNEGSIYAFSPVSVD